MDMIREMVGSDGTVREKDKEAIQFVKEQDRLGQMVHFGHQAAAGHADAGRCRPFVDYQREYFLDGDRTRVNCGPMILKDIADTQLGLRRLDDLAAWWRYSKYVQTRIRHHPASSQLFSEAMQTESGEEVSSYEIKNILCRSVSTEEDKRHPLTDEALHGDSQLRWATGSPGARWPSTARCSESRWPGSANRYR